ncbi:MAG: beta-lactamase family protein [Kiritimatiellales bacterium]|nr:beta-lactamase family protein [Kiritimatiellales bacterium]
MKFFRLRSAGVIGLIVGMTISVPSQAEKNAFSTAFSTEAKVEALRSSAPEPEAPFGFIFNLDTPPQFVWRSPALAEHGICPTIEEVAWFDAEGKRFEKPEHGGRWIAIVRSKLPDGKTVIRSITLFGRPEGFFLLPLESLGIRLDDIEEGVPEPLATHRKELRQVVERGLLEFLNGEDPRGARLAAALDDSRQEDGAKRLRYGVEDRSRSCELRARLAYEGRTTQLLPPPRHLEKGEQAPELRPAKTPPPAEALAELDRICQGWADESGAPFSSLVAKGGAILHHAAFSPKGNQAIDLDFRADVFSITKAISGILAARFLDAGLFALDQPVSAVFTDFAQHPGHIPTFRQCLRHQSGLKGHGSWGGVGNAWFDHVVFNGIETLEQTPTQKYAGDGFDLVGTAMQLLSGETTTRLFHEGYFAPLGLPLMPYEGMGAGARPTVFQLAVLGQIMANEGRYGACEFFSRETFDAILPTAYEGYENPDPDNKLHFYGLGIRWVREDRDEAGKPLFSRRTIGHGSFSFSVFQVDLENKIVIAQVREKKSQVDAKWYPQFLEAVHGIMIEGKTN